MDNIKFRLSNGEILYIQGRDKEYSLYEDNDIIHLAEDNGDFSTFSTLEEAVACLLDTLGYWA